MKNFELHRIKHPGRVNLPRLGTIDLALVSDELAQELYDKGLPYLKPKGKSKGQPSPVDDPEKYPDILSEPDHDT